MSNTTLIKQGVSVLESNKSRSHETRKAVITAWLDARTEDELYAMTRELHGRLAHEMPEMELCLRSLLYARVDMYDDRMKTDFTNVSALCGKIKSGIFHPDNDDIYYHPVAVPDDLNPGFDVVRCTARVGINKDGSMDGRILEITIPKDFAVVGTIKDGHFIPNPGLNYYPDAVGEPLEIPVELRPEQMYDEPYAARVKTNFDGSLLREVISFHPFYTEYPARGIPEKKLPYCSETKLEDYAFEFFLSYRPDF